MARRTKSRGLAIRSAPTMIAKAPASSACHSTYPSETEEEQEMKKTPAEKSPTFAFLHLPSELRNRIYTLTFSSSPSVIDLDPHTFSQLHRNKTLALFSVSRQVHAESTHRYFSTHTFRLFPTYPGRYFKTKTPLLARLPQHYRSSITNLELRLGPGWNNPPRGWIINDDLGLQDCTSVRVLKVFVECDPSDGIFKGFRASEGFYERFCQGLLEGVLTATPTISTVEFDAWSSVKRSGDMIQGLGKVVSTFGKTLGWGPERGWEKEADNIWQDAILKTGGATLSKSVAVYA